MNNKYAAAIILLVLVIGGIFYLKHSANNSSSNPNDLPKIEIDHTTSKPDLTNGTFIFDDSNITLKGGKADTEVAPGSQEVQTTTLTDKIAYGDLNNDSKEDAAAVFVQEGAGTGVFIYVGAYVSGTVRYNGSNTIFVGDRINPQSITINKGVITLSYLDRKEDEPLSATPSVSKTQSFVYINGELKEIK